MSAETKNALLEVDEDGEPVVYVIVTHDNRYLGVATTRSEAQSTLEMCGPIGTCHIIPEQLLA